MSAYANEWKVAKEKFKKYTQEKAPKEDKNSPLAEGAKHKSGIEGLLKRVDKLIPEKNAFDTVSNDDIQNIQKNLNDIKKKAAAYVNLLDKAIAKEKAAVGGKNFSASYRDLKILKAELDRIVASITADHKSLTVAKQASEKNLQRKTETIFKDLKAAKQRVLQQVAKSIVLAQKILKNPTVENWNYYNQSMCRDVTQPLSNIEKWGTKDAANARQKAMRDGDIAKDPELKKFVELLQQEILKVEGEIHEFGKQKGNNAFNGSLAYLAQGKGILKPENTPDDVVKAVKNVLKQLKEVKAEISKLGSR